MNQQKKGDGEIFSFGFSSLAEGDSQRPAAVKGRAVLGRGVSVPLDGEDRCKTIEQQEMGFLGRIQSREQTRVKG